MSIPTSCRAPESEPAAQVRSVCAPAPSNGPVRTVAVAGGKGGVGASVVATNLAMALARTQPGVLLFDAALALGDVATLLGLESDGNVHGGIPAVLDGRTALDRLLRDGPGGIRVIGGSSCDIALSRLSHIEHARLIALFSATGISADTLLVDIPSGLSDPALAYASAARETVIVVTDEPTSLGAATAIVHELHTRYRKRRFRVLVNRVDNARQALDVHGALLARFDDRADIVLDYAGAIPEDPHVAESVRVGTPVVELHPRAPAALAFAKLATRLARWPRPATPAGHIEFFVERLIQAADPTLVRAMA